MNLLNWWIDSFNFSKDDIKLFQSYETDFKTEPVEYDTVRAKAVDMLPMQTISNYNVSFDSCATNIINKLFDNYVSENTLVITTTSEHPSVKKALNKCKNVSYMYNKCQLDTSFINKLERFNNIFIYCIGLSVGDKQITNNDIISLLKDYLERSNIKATFVLDAVQELYMLPRDYSIYDYVIATAHAFITSYDTGILFSKEKLESDNTWLYRGNKYLDILKLMLPHKDKLFMFHYIMMQYFGKYINSDKSLYVSDNAPYVFTIHDKQNRLVGITKSDLIASPSTSLVTFRACEAIINQDEFLEKCRTVKYILENS